jgi:hypothetical protein
MRCQSQTWKFPFEKNDKTVIVPAFVIKARILNVDSGETL